MKSPFTIESDAFAEFESQQPENPIEFEETRLFEDPLGEREAALDEFEVLASEVLETSALEATEDSRQARPSRGAKISDRAVRETLTMAACRVPGLGITIKDLLIRHQAESGGVPIEVLLAFIYFEAGNRLFDDATAGKWNEKYHRYSPAFYELGVFQTPAGDHGCIQEGGTKRCKYEAPGQNVQRSPFGQGWYRLTKTYPTKDNWKDPTMQVRIGLWNLTRPAEYVARGFPGLFQSKQSEWYVRMAVLYSFAQGAGWTRAFLGKYKNELFGLPESERWDFLRGKQAYLKGHGIKTFDPENVDKKMVLAAKLRPVRTATAAPPAATNQPVNTPAPAPSVKSPAPIGSAPTSTPTHPTLPRPASSGRACRFGFTPRAVESPGGGRVRKKSPPKSADLVKVQGVAGPIPLDSMAAAAWKALVAAARADGVAHPLLLPTSGFRDPEHQRRLWERALIRYGSAGEARKWVAPPGSSAHQSGRAIDFYLGGKNSSGNVASLRRLPAHRWIVQNAVCFGFYPYEAEPWHWEYNPPGQAGIPSPKAKDGVFGSKEVSGLTGYPESVLTALRSGSEGMAIKFAIGLGYRDEAALTNLVFSARHPERRGRKLAKGEPRLRELSNEWLNIRDRLVRLALRKAPPPAPGAAPKRSPSFPSPTTAAPALIKREEQPAASTLYVNMPLGTESPARPMTGIFIPENYVTRAQVDLILYLHGHRTPKVCGPGDSVSIDGYWRSRYWPLREDVNRSGKNIILVAPTLGPNSQPGRLTDPSAFEAYLDQVLASLTEYGPYREAGRSPTVGNIVLASHSGGGSPMRHLALGSHRYADRIRECWSFDSLYDSADPELWERWARSHPDARLFIFYLGSTQKLSKQLKDRLLPNVVVEGSSARNHCLVPAEHWGHRIQSSGFFLER